MESDKKHGESSEGEPVKIGERLQGLRLFSECKAGEEYRAQLIHTALGDLKFPNGDTELEKRLAGGGRGSAEFVLRADGAYVVGFVPHDGTVVYLLDKPNGVLKQRGESDIDLHELLK